MAKKRAGRKGAAQTLAPKKERISGSKTNKRGSASASTRSSIKFSEGLTNKIKAFLKEYNKANPTKKITLPTAKKVVRRGMGAYSSTHRPTISGGRPNSRQAWGIARLHAFARKKSRSQTAKGVVSSRPIKKSYTQDNDLL
ncbi:MAG: hypothetical protein CMI29_04640 [Opitutae bacterium]|nr:hypothetical protein [Opitutae bacterium]|tara:strand:- start:23630 stop:24052 length:423 start_codon:yes stop_codon:yes gene_type:complete